MRLWPFCVVILSLQLWPFCVVIMSLQVLRKFLRLLMDLSKAFDCILDELLLAKLNAYGLDKISLTFMHAYLSQRQHKTKVGSTFRELMGILFGVPQGSILGPLLFIIYNCD